MDLAEVKNRRRTGNKTDGFIVKADDLGWLIAEVERLTALCDEYRGEVAVLKAGEEKTRAYWSSAYYRMEAKCEELQSALTRARAEGMEDKTDAERWRAVVGCARIRVLGSAGIVDRKPDGYAHLGLELWTRHSAESEPAAVEWLTAFADIASACRLAEQANKGE